MGETRHDLESLLSETGWVRSLARTLSRDSASADDLAQEAYARAIAAPPPAETPLRRWFALVIRNLAREQHRGEGRRAKRERAAAREERIEAESALFERLEVHRELVEAVSRLDEPYRAVILLRYFEGLGPAAIAERTGVPIRTVHTRLSRALARLRDELDRSHGGRERWLLALVPFAAEPSRPVAAAIGALVMDAKIKVAIAAVVVAAVCATVIMQGAAPRPVEPLALGLDTNGSPIVPKEKSGPALESAPTLGGRIAGEVETASTKPTTGSPSAANVLHGRVIDVLGAPLAAMRVRIAPASDVRERPEAISGSDGRFTIEDPPRRGELEIATPRFTTVLRPQLWEGREGIEFVLVAAPAVELAGVVIDAARQPIAGAMVVLPVASGLRSRFSGLDLEPSSDVAPRMRADEQGRFHFSLVAAYEGADLVTTQATYAEDRRPVSARDDLALEIVLRPSEGGPARIAGRVVDISGAGVEDAWVTFGSVTTKSGSGGAFVLVPDGKMTQVSTGAWTQGVLQAGKTGYQRARYERKRELEPWPPNVLLQLGPPPLSIRGKVVDADGHAVRGARVWTPEEQPLGWVELSIEGTLMRIQATAESIARGEVGLQSATTDEEGRFELRGLTSRDYRIVAIDKRAVSISSASFAAGAENVELRLPREERHARVAGRVTDLSGAPLSGIQVAVERLVAGELGAVVERIESDSVTSDADGRFEFRDLPRSLVGVRLWGSDLYITGVRREIPPAADVEHLAFSVPLRVRLQVEGGAHAEFDRIGVLDEEASPLSLTVLRGNSASLAGQMPLEDGRTELFSVPETARTLVLYRDGAEVGRRPLELVHGTVNVIRP
jgi:RNA polymerase sigma factor (sigma-70 family)